MEFRKQTLGNGLTIVAECNPAAYTSAFGFFVNAGARDETDAVAGVSHFLEHMAFKGTATRSADDVNRQFDEMGADYNAYTSEENTVYYGTVLPEHQDAVVGLLSDIIRPSLREEDFDTEKQVIIEEIRMYDDQPPFGADDRCKANHFGSHPLSRSVLGTAESVSGLHVEQMRDYFNSRYCPTNITLVGSGKIDFDALVERAGKSCGHWPRATAERQAPRNTHHGGFETVSKESATHEYVLELANGPSSTDDDRFAAKLLSTVLGDDSGSRFYWELIDSGLAEQASVSHYGYQGTGLFMVYMSCTPDRAEKNLQLMSDILRKAETQGITPTELSQARSKISSRVVLSSERPRGRLFSVGSNWINRQCYSTVSEDLQELEKVTCEEIGQLLKRYPLSEPTTIAIGPLSTVAEPK